MMRYHHCLRSSRLHVAAPCCSPASSWRGDWCPAARADVSCSSFHLRGSRYVQPAAVSTTSDFSAKLVHGDTTLLRCNGVAQKWFMGRTMNLQEQAHYYSTTVWVAGPGFSLLSHRKSWSRTRDQAKKKFLSTHLLQKRILMQEHRSCQTLAVNRPIDTGVIQYKVRTTPADYIPHFVRRATRKPLAHVQTRCAYSTSNGFLAKCTSTRSTKRTCWRV